MSTLSRSPALQQASTASVHPSKISLRKAMSITQTYYLAHTARGKLSQEAARADHDLRLLVGHANLLDSLMIELADAEQEQERWFNQSVTGANKASEDKHIQWADAIVEEPEADWDVEDAEDSESSDSDSEYDEDEDIEMVSAPLRRTPSRSTVITSTEVDYEEDEEEYEDDDEEDYSQLTLTRTSSNHVSSPPELLLDSDEESEDESMPPSPPQPTFDFTEQERKAIATTSFYEKAKAPVSGSLSPAEQASFFDEGFYLPERTAQSTPMISAF